MGRFFEEPAPAHQPTAVARCDIPRYYRPELDALRLVAFALVFINHRSEFAPSNPDQNPLGYALSLVGEFGVPVFFLLSAFLITELLMRERERFGRVSVKNFYLRRMLRIWPLYFLVFFGLAALNRVVPGTGLDDPLAWLAFTLFAGNWYISLFGWVGAYPVNPLWSLGVEEQFYLLIPLAAGLASRRALIGICVALIATAYALTGLWYPPRLVSGTFSPQWTNSFVQFQFFAAGMLLALLLSGRAPRWPVVLRLSAAAAAFGCWVIAYMLLGVEADNPTSTRAQALLGWPLLLGGTVLLFLALLGLPEKYLPRPVVYLGRISYGLYMLHALMLFLVFSTHKQWLDALCRALQLEPWRNAIGTVLVLALTVGAAMLSYRFVERPFLRLKRRFTVVPSRD